MIAHHVPQANGRAIPYMLAPQERKPRHFAGVYVLRLVTILYTRGTQQ